MSSYTNDPMRAAERDIGDIRVAIAKIETLAGITHDRAKMAFTRMDGIDGRITALESRVTEVGHHLKTAVRDSGLLMERVTHLEKPPVSRSRATLEVLLPLMVLAFAAAFNLPLKEVVGFLTGK